MAPFTSRHRQSFVTSKNDWRCHKLCRRFFLYKTNKNVEKREICTIVAMTLLTSNSKLCKFIISWRMIEVPQTLNKIFFPTKLKKTMQKRVKYWSLCPVKATWERIVWRMLYLSFTKSFDQEIIWSWAWNSPLSLNLFKWAFVLHRDERKHEYYYRFGKRLNDPIASEKSYWIYLMNFFANNVHQ